MFKADSHRTGTTVSAVCECGTAPESVEHFLVHCPLHEEARNRMTKNIKEIWNTSKSTKKRQLNLTEELLLAPSYDENSVKK